MPRFSRPVMCASCLCNCGVTGRAKDICDDCLGTHEKIKAVHAEAMKKYPELRYATLDEFVARLWKKVDGISTAAKGTVRNVQKTAAARKLAR